MTPRIYPAIIVRVIDGDTLVARADLGFRTFFEDSFRLVRCNAPEGKRSEAATYLCTLLPAGKAVTLTSYKPEKFGRWLVDLRWDECESLVVRLVERGFVTPYAKR